MNERMICPDCGAERAVQTDRCWLCGRAWDSAVAFPLQREIAAAQRPQFGIASMMLTVTLIAVCLGVLRLAPGLGIALAIFVTPAFVRATVFIAREKEAGRPLGMDRKIYAFLSSLGLVLALVMAAGVAFYITCWGGFFAGAAASSVAGVSGYGPLVYGLWTGIGLGIVGQIVFTVFFCRWLWRRRKEQRNRLGDVGFILSWVGFAGVYTYMILDLMVARHVSRWGGMAWLLCGLIALPGLIFSLFALGKPQRLLASWGVGLGVVGCGLPLMLLLINLSWPLVLSGPEKPIVSFAALLIGLLAAVAIALLVVRRFE